MRSGSTIIRWTLSGFVVARRIASITTGPSVMLGTKRPSITSTWIQSAPAASTARTSSARRPKSADRMDGATTRGLANRRSPQLGEVAVSLVTFSFRPPIKAFHDFANASPPSCCSFRANASMSTPSRRNSSRSCSA